MYRNMVSCSSISNRKQCTTLKTHIIKRWHIFEKVNTDKTTEMELEYSE